VSFLQNLNFKFFKWVKFSSTSKHRHIAYQIKANKEWNTNLIFIRQYDDPVASGGQEKPKNERRRWYAENSA